MNLILAVKLAQASRLCPVTFKRPLELLAKIFGSLVLIYQIGFVVIPLVSYDPRDSMQTSRQ